MSWPAPYLVSWNLTKRCNLLCGHCYLDAAELSGEDALSGAEALRVLGEVAACAPGAMLVLTGGEPLSRPDIFDLTGRASALGLNPVLGTNGTLLTTDTARRLSAAGIKGAGVSLDSCSPDFHDRFRGVEGAWRRALDGISALRSTGIPFQLQFTVTSENSHEIDRAASLAKDLGAFAVNFFFLVCTGRGQRSADLSPAEYESALEAIVLAEKRHRGSVLVRARCAPHIVRVAERSDPGGPLANGATSGCVAGKGYLRISPEGLVTPCPYIPADASSPSVMKTPLKEIWENDPAFAAMRRAQLSGRCAECSYAASCGGCRARALASTSDVMAEDPWCVHEPKDGVREKARDEGPSWSPEAIQRLESAPAFLRPMIKKGIEKYAASRGIPVITPGLMAELREKAGR